MENGVVFAKMNRTQERERMRERAVAQVAYNFRPFGSMPKFYLGKQFSVWYSVPFGSERSAEYSLLRNSQQHSHTLSTLYYYHHDAAVTCSLPAYQNRQRRWLTLVIVHLIMKNKIEVKLSHGTHTICTYSVPCNEMSLEVESKSNGMVDSDDLI